MAVFHTVHRLVPALVQHAVHAAIRSEGVKARIKKHRFRFRPKHIEALRRAGEDNKRLGLSTKAYREGQEKLSKMSVGDRASMRWSKGKHAGRRPTLPKLKCLETD